MLRDITLALWFLLPAALANASPIISAVIPKVRNWNYPIDGGRKWRGHEIFGAHKTWRGLITGILVATLILFLQRQAFIHYEWARTLAGGVDYKPLPVLLLGPLFGIGALGGDAIESFFKRQRNIESGHSWLPFDQLDYIVGGILVSLPFIRLRPVVYGWMLILWFIIHLVASYTGYKLGLKRRPI